MSAGTASALSAIALLLLSAPSVARAAPRVCLVEEAIRVAVDGPGDAQCEERLALTALRGEHAAFQVAVASPVPLRDVTLELVADTPAAPVFDGFVEHFVEARQRSSTNGGPAALAFTEAARPPDDGNLGFLPDALIPFAIAPPWAPYPEQVTPSRAALSYFEAFVPLDAEPGLRRYRLVARSSGELLAERELTLEVVPLSLPYAAVRAFAFYERETLEQRFGDADAVERSLVQLLHAHGVDAITQLRSASDVDRLRGSFDGSWFTPASGYRGPGAGLSTAVAAIGAYGSLRQPAIEKLPSIRAMVERLANVDDVFLYAIDEQCQSSYGGDWRELLRGANIGLRVGQTCHEPPRDQAVDVVMMPAQAFDPDRAREARALAKQVWIYNGQLPFAGPPTLDVPATSLTVNGWISAAFDVDRWFYWETVFWNDGNRGGKGPSDVFENAATFHNADGDTALLDGLLLYPGRMPSALGSHDVGRDVVLPSLRLKALRRGLEDGALHALAAQVDARATFRENRAIVRRALDEVGDKDATHLDLRASALREARAELRRIIRSAAVEPSADGASVASGLRALRALRQNDRSRTGFGAPPSVLARAVVGFFLPCALAVFGWAVARSLSERARR